MLSAALYAQLDAPSQPLAAYELLVLITCCVPISMQLVRSDRFNLSVRDCPPGYVQSSLAQGFVTCKCDFDNPNIFDCEGETILLAVRWYKTHSNFMRPCDFTSCDCVYPGTC